MEWKFPCTYFTRIFCSVVCFLCVFVIKPLRSHKIPRSQWAVYQAVRMLILTIKTKVTGRE